MKRNTKDWKYEVFMGVDAEELEDEVNSFIKGMLRKNLKEIKCVQMGDTLYIYVAYVGDSCKSRVKFKEVKEK